MRQVNRINCIKPKALNALSCQKHLHKIIRNPQIKPLPKYYKGLVKFPDKSIKNTVKESLKVLYLNKCAYCEKYSYNPYIDHHRPKGKVIGTQNSTGYYWLVYEWTNLLPSCHDCNSITAKSSNFPIVGLRNNKHPKTTSSQKLDLTSFKYDAQFNTSEIPLLIHPEYSDPLLHFDFDRNGIALGQTPEGEKTIETLKLNREDLVFARKKIFQDHLDLLQLIIVYSIENSLILGNITTPIFIDYWIKKLYTESIDPSLDFTLFRKKLLYSHEYFFVKSFDPRIQGFVHYCLTSHMQNAGILKL